MNKDIPIIDSWKESRMKGSGRCFRGKVFWQEHTLWESARLQELKPFELPIAGIPLDIMPWDLNTIEDIAFHVMKVQEADLSYPIILDDYGNIRDGYHRLVKALMEGRSTIQAIRIKHMPEIDGKEE